MSKTPVLSDWLFKIAPRCHGTNTVKLICGHFTSSALNNYDTCISQSHEATNSIDAQLTSENDQRLHLKAAPKKGSGLPHICLCLTLSQTVFVYVLFLLYCLHFLTSGSAYLYIHDLLLLSLHILPCLLLCHSPPPLHGALPPQPVTHLLSLFFQWQW